MSEHMSINGVVNYWHLPYDEEGAFTYCNHCKKTCDRVTVEFHEGWMDNWINLRCAKCKKSIWTSKLKRKQTKDDKKCQICKKPTNWIDCEIHGGSFSNKRHNYWCSRKCYNKSYMDELEACAKEQKIELDFQDKIKIAREILK